MDKLVFIPHKIISMKREFKPMEILYAANSNKFEVIPIPKIPKIKSPTLGPLNLR